MRMNIVVVYGRGRAILYGFPGPMVTPIMSMISRESISFSTRNLEIIINNHLSPFLRHSFML